MTAHLDPLASWLPRASDAHGRGEHLRRSFETRLEGRPQDAGASALEAIDALERLHEANPAELGRLRSLLSLDTRRALVAFSRSPHDAQAVTARLIELPDTARDLIRRVLDLPAEAASSLEALLAE